MLPPAWLPLLAGGGTEKPGDEGSRRQTPDPPLPSYDRVRAVVGPEPVDLHEIRARTGCPPRTIRYALRRLVDDGVLRKTWSLQDTRRTLYYRAVEVSR